MLRIRSGSIISSESGSGSGLDDQKLEKTADEKLHFTYTKAFLKDVQATGEAFSSQKRTYNNSKNKIH